MEKLDIVHAVSVLRMKEIVIFTTNVEEAKDVDQTVVQLHLALVIAQIVVI